MSPLNLNPVLQELVGLRKTYTITLQSMYKTLKPVKEDLWDNNQNEMIYTIGETTWKCVLVPDQLRPNRFEWRVLLGLRFEVTPVTVENEFDEQAGGAADPPPLLTAVRTVREILDLGDITASQLSSARRRVLIMQQQKDKDAMAGADAAIVASLGITEASMSRTEELRLARVALSAVAENTIAAQEAADEDDQMEALTLLEDDASRRQAAAGVGAVAAFRVLLGAAGGPGAIVRAGVAGQSQAGPSQALAQVCRCTCTCLAFYSMWICGA